MSMTTTQAAPGRVESAAAPVTRLRDDSGAAARERRAAARSRDLTALLRQRPDLAGVYLPADLTVESVQWSV